MAVHEDTTLNTTVPSLEEKSKDFDIMQILQIIIASVGIVANFTVVMAFLNHKKLRGKIPNMFIINQVSVTVPVNYAHQ